MTKAFVGIKEPKTREEVGAVAVSCSMGANFVVGRRNTRPFI